MIARRVLLFRGILAAIVATIGAIALFLTAILLDSYRAQQFGLAPTAGVDFVRRGSVYVTANPNMISQSFPAVKGSGEFRVFVLGSSEVMGTPYVHQSFNMLSGRLLGMPNEGGVSTWLTQYLERLFPRRRIRVVNAAQGGRDLADSAETMEQAAAIGEPDLVVVLDGNNERDRDHPLMSDFDLASDSDFASSVDRLTRNVRRQLARIVSVAEKRRIPTYILTVPNNLRDWKPNGRTATYGLSAEVDGLTQRDPRAAVKFLRSRASGGGREPRFWWLLGRALDRAGDFAAARDSYTRAKDLDRAFLRARTPWNEAIREIKGNYARPIDMERIMFSYARDGIPGNDLFHDYCHMKLGANRLVAFEIAKRVKADMRISRPLALGDAELAPFTARQLRLLYLIKAFQWTRSMWALRRNGIQSSNAAAALLQFRKDADAIEGQIRLFQSSARRGGA